MNSTSEDEPASVTAAPTDQEMSQIGLASKLGLDMLAAILVGGGLGFGFDKWQNTLPWGMLIGLALGIAAGMRQLIVFAKQQSNGKK